MALSNLTKVQTLGIGSNIEVVGVITTGEFKSGTSNLHSTGVELTNLNVSGVGTIGGNLSVGGVLTYEDVTNIDSVGVVTAREGIFIPDNKKIHLGNASGSGDLQIYHTGAHSYIADEGVGELIISGNRVQLMNAARSGKLFDSVEGASGYLKLYQNNNVRLEATNTGATITGDITISDKIIHAGDTNTALRFPSADTITAETGGSERVRIDSSGSVGIGTDNPAKKLEVFDATQGVIRIRGGAGGSDSSRKADLSLFASGAREYVVRADASDAAFKIVDVSGSNAERLIITSDGKIGINQTSPQTGLHINQDWVNSYGSISVEGSANVLVGLGLRSNGNYRGSLIWRDGSSGNYMDISTYGGAYPILFRPNGSEKVRINSNGDLGLLKIADNNTSSAGNHGFRFGSWGIQMRDTGGFNHWYIRRNYGGWQTSPQVTFKGNGYTGVNRLDPTHYLDVDGTSIFRDRIFSGTMSMKSIPFGANVTYDTGISINAYGYGGSILALCSRNYGAGTSTQAGLYFLEFKYDGNNMPTIHHVSGDNFVSFNKSASNTLTVNMGASNNNITMIESSVVNP